VTDAEEVLHVNDARSAERATPFSELNELLEELVGYVESVLGDNLIGAYVIGSFALGAGDPASDCDFLVVTAEQVGREQERALRRRHREIPAREGYWEQNLEGSYAPIADLETLERLDRKWLYIDRGFREMQWSTHCNTEDSRWILRERGVILAGPEPRAFACEVPADALRHKARLQIESFLPDLFTWTSFDIAWSQRYAVETLCRMLFTLETGAVTSKRAALEWAKPHLSSVWHGLIDQALADRAVQWDDPPRSGSVEATIAFAAYARERAALSPS
jgi:predicted nucleotidyltransferase